ncbi:MAG: response regulator transcription factor [Deltaproteobacteria bacterium]|nr:response regulator transcription factor [Deltaproteobacteria bacterium]
MVLANDPSTTRILVVEDEKHIAEGLKLNLSLSGYEVAVADSGPRALALWEEVCPHLIVLDVMLPGMDGITVLRRIRTQDEKVPILILSARGEARDRVEGLRHGVDDYMVKPFDLEEFLLRVERLLARSRGRGAEGAGEPKMVRFGQNQVDLASRTAWCRAGTIQLSEQEARLLRVFFDNPKRALSRKELLEVAWGYSGRTSTRTVDNFLVRFRKYFEENPKKPKHFKSVRSVGYLFSAD